MLPPGTFVDGRYEVGTLVGRGGMADVFRADDVVTGEPVAVKVLRIQDRESLARFRHETEVLRLLDHPAVVRLRDAGWHATNPYLVLDLVEGPTLAGVLGDGALGLDRAVATGEQLASALAHAHGLDVVHRDVKPSNVLFAADDPAHPRLADFGIARMSDATRLTATGSCVGTAAYLAPEQLEGGTGPPADVYSLGLLVLECITGALCYPGTVAEAAIARLHRAPVVPPDLPGWLRHTLRAMTDRRPQRRPSAEQVTRALGERSLDPLLRPTQPVRLAVGALALHAEPVGAAEALGHVAGDAQRAPRRPPVLGGVLTVAVVALVALSAAVVWLNGGQTRGAESQPASSATTPSTVASAVEVPAVEPAAAEPPGPGSADPPAPAAPGPGPAAHDPGPAPGRGHAHGHDRPRPGDDDEGGDEDEDD
jgi:hypothetical protein